MATKPSTPSVSSPAAGTASAPPAPAAPAVKKAARRKATALPAKRARAVQAQQKAASDPKTPQAGKAAKRAGAGQLRKPPAAAKVPAPAPAPLAAPEAKKSRPKLVRDGFTMPESDFALIATLKARAIEAQRPAKKSELLRAGLRALMDLPPSQLATALSALESIKTGRPKKGH